MNRIYLTSAMAGLLLFSCAKDELVDPYAGRGSGNGNDVIAFNMNLGNQTRANVELQDAGFNNFGVWAVKANGETNVNHTGFIDRALYLNDPDKISDQVVMNDYRVQHEATEHNGSYWTYVTEEWAENPLSLSQFLKYWDGSFTNTYFIGYAPQNKDRSGKNVKFKLVSNVPMLTFPSFTTTSNQTENYIYSDVKKAVNSEYIYTPTKDKVDLQFHRVFSNVKIAIWEDIPGYNVEMINFDFVDPGTKNNNIVAIPANLTVVPGGTNTWAKGSYVYSGTPKVEYSGDDLATSTLTMSNVTMWDGTSNPNFDFALPKGYIGQNYATASKSATTYNVIPNNKARKPDSWTMAGDQTWAANSGLQFVMSYRLKSEDTNETITVKGARVYVPATYTAWAPNTVYTYVFRITKDSSGTTTGTDPNPNPEDPKPGLYPIIFDGVTVATETETSEWMVNQKIKLSQSLVALQPLGTVTLTASEVYTDETDIPYTYTWSSSDDAVATVSNTGLVTAGSTVGTAVITATTNETGISASATVHVYTATATPAPVSVDKGATTTLANPFTPNTLPVTWSSSNSMIAEVGTNSGIVKGVSAGTATITCTLAPGVTVDFTVTVP